MNRKEFVAANGAVDNIRDVWQQTEAASGSAFDDRILGDNTTKLLVTKDELDNVNLITGLQGFFPVGIVSFDGGNIMLGGGGSDSLIGGGGGDVIDGDAWLHLGLTSYSAGGSIIRQIMYDANGNTYDPATANYTLDANGPGHSRLLHAWDRPRKCHQRRHRCLQRHHVQLQRCLFRPGCAKAS